MVDGRTVEGRHGKLAAPRCSPSLHAPLALQAWSWRESEGARGCVRPTRGRSPCSRKVDEGCARQGAGGVVFVTSPTARTVPSSFEPCSPHRSPRPERRRPKGGVESGDGALRRLEARTRPARLSRTTAQQAASRCRAQRTSARADAERSACGSTIGMGSAQDGPSGFKSVRSPRRENH
jgi:hypothetical protein